MWFSPRKGAWVSKQKRDSVGPKNLGPLQTQSLHNEVCLDCVMCESAKVWLGLKAQTLGAKWIAFKCFLGQHRMKFCYLRRRLTLPFESFSFANMAKNGTLVFVSNAKGQPNMKSPLLGFIFNFNRSKSSSTSTLLINLDLPAEKGFLTYNFINSMRRASMVKREEKT